MQIIINLIIFLITLFLYIHINFHLKTNNDLEILDVDEITREQLEEVCNYKQPIFFKFYNPDIHERLKLERLATEYKTFDVNIRNITHYLGEDNNILPLSFREARELFLKDTSSNYISEQNQDFIDETTVRRNIEANDLFLRPNLCSQCHYDFIFGSQSSYTPLRYELNCRNYICAIDGEIEIMLTIPNNAKYLNIVKDYDLFEFRSGLNPFNPDDIESLERVKFLSVTLQVGDIIMIPYKWLYTIKLKSPDSIVCCMKYRVAMNTLAILPELFYRFLYQQNIKFNFLNTIS